MIKKLIAINPILFSSLITFGQINDSTTSKEWIVELGYQHFRLLYKNVSPLIYISNQINRELPNGWGYSISIGQWTDENNVSYEGVGLAPDVVVQNKRQDILNGKDEALEKEIELLNQ